MSEHRATIDWQRSSADFTYMTYNRAHDWRFKAATVPASATKEYRGDENRVNPEEALVAALSSCHMLVFLAVAAKRKLGARHLLRRCRRGPREERRRQARDHARDTTAANPLVGRGQRLGRGPCEDAPRCSRGLLHCELGQD